MTTVFAMIGLVTGIVDFEYHANSTYYGRKNKDYEHANAMQSKRFNNYFNITCLYIIFISTVLAIILRTMKFT